MLIYYAILIKKTPFLALKVNLKEKEDRDARLSKLPPAIRNVLKGNPNIFHCTTDKIFSPVCELEGGQETYPSNIDHLERELP